MTAPAMTAPGSAARPWRAWAALWSAASVAAALLALVPAPGVQLTRGYPWSGVVGVIGFLALELLALRACLGGAPLVRASRPRVLAVLVGSLLAFLLHLQTWPATDTGVYLAVPVFTQLGVVLRALAALPKAPKAKRSAI